MTHRLRRPSGNVIGSSEGGRLPNNFKPYRDPALPIKDVLACPDCGAEVGDPCVTQKGQPSSTCHTSRRRLARRAQRNSSANE